MSHSLSSFALSLYKPKPFNQKLASRSGESAIAEKDSDRVKEALDQLSEVG
ncbi:hypothetical protein OROHE_011061 [Orobanche hederae]